MSNTKPTAPDLIERLVNIGSIKVWSLLVTIFGDLTYQNRNSLSGAQLNELFHIMNIKPEALRVALHRLRKDGWITSTKTGRNSHYQISDTGLAETQKVWNQIYVPNNGLNKEWHISVFADSSIKPDGNAIKLNNSSYIIDKLKTPNANDALLFPLANLVLPNWVEDKLRTEGAEKLSLELFNISTQINTNNSDIDPIENTALRVLILHHWRRIALRDASWLHIKHFENGQVRQCHDAVHHLLKNLKN